MMSNEQQPSIHVAPAPHIGSTSLSTRKMMIDVMIGLAPVFAVAVYVFRQYAVYQAVVCVLSCLLAEAVFAAMRRRWSALFDGSTIITGLILAFSIPATAPWYVGLIGSFAAIGIGKAAFGGLGNNLFNPAMVGRAFVMMAFPVLLGAKEGGYANSQAAVDVVTQATPMTAWKQEHAVTPLADLFWGTTNGSVGETSAIACLLGGLYLCIRRTASWEIPAGTIIAAAAIAGCVNLANPDSQWTVMHELLGGALLFGAFFIATDPVTSPLTPRGKFIFGLGVGTMVMVLRLLSNYPEGMMFSILLLNAVVPLINRWTVPTPVGGPAKGAKK